MPMYLLASFYRAEDKYLSSQGSWSTVIVGTRPQVHLGLWTGQMYKKLHAGIEWCLVPEVTDQIYIARFAENLILQSFYILIL